MNVSTYTFQSCLDDSVKFQPTDAKLGILRHSVFIASLPFDTLPKSTFSNETSWFTYICIALFSTLIIIIIIISRCLRRQVKVNQLLHPGWKWPPQVTTVLCKKNVKCLRCPRKNDTPFLKVRSRTTAKDSVSLKTVFKYGKPLANISIEIQGNNIAALRYF